MILLVTQSVNGLKHLMAEPGNNFNCLMGTQSIKRTVKHVIN